MMPFIRTLALLPLLVVGAHAIAQTVCVGGDAKCKTNCKGEPAPPNLTVEHPARLSGAFYDASGAPLNFDAIKPDHQTIVQIKSTVSGEILFAVPLRATGQFDFEFVPMGSYRLILVWMKKGKFERLPLADQPGPMNCAEEKVCQVTSTIRFHGSDNPIDFCPPK